MVCIALHVISGCDPSQTIDYTIWRRVLGMLASEEFGGPVALDASLVNTTAMPRLPKQPVPPFTADTVAWEAWNQQLVAYQARVRETVNEQRLNHQAILKNAIASIRQIQVVLGNLTIRPDAKAFGQKDLILLNSVPVDMQPHEVDVELIQTQNALDAVHRCSMVDSRIVEALSSWMSCLGGLQQERQNTLRHINTVLDVLEKEKQQLKEKLTAVQGSER
ncbi:uncharacterized protein CTRU02_215684 [Colletotrichum truncatum]|uniref:Uncharacterized protein n=1 Tax=Colletotrichum truncatum TaxID=5467 RepID=A0ACC3YBW1_COLTU